MKRKTCRTCRVEKEIGLFNRDTSTKDGWCRQCRICMRAARTRSKQRVAARNRFHPTEGIQALLTTAEATERVARGAAHLDVVRPGWFHRIDVGRLTLGSCVDCILGQLFRDEAACAPGEPLAFAHGLKSLGWWDIGYEENGVGGFVRSEDMATTQDAWIAAIADRVLAAAQEHEQPASVAAEDRNRSLISSVSPRVHV